MKILIGILFSSLVLISSTLFAADKTAMGSNWICTTNASSSDNSADKAADKTMSEHGDSAVKAFAFASHHCRDCTKITCEVK